MTVDEKEVTVQYATYTLIYGPIRDLRHVKYK